MRLLLSTALVLAGCTSPGGEDGAGSRVIALSPGHERPSAFKSGYALDLVAACQALAAAGVERLLLREPALGEDELRRVIGHVQPHFKQLILHAKCANATAIARDLHLPLHLGGDIRWWERNRSSWEGGLGVSAHSEGDVYAARSWGFDYAFLSPVSRPTSKPNDRREPLGEAYLAKAQMRNDPMPVYALGGVTPEIARRLVGKGVAGVAVLGGMWNQTENPKRLRANLRNAKAILGAIEAGLREGGHGGGHGGGREGGEEGGGDGGEEGGIDGDGAAQLETAQLETARLEMAGSTTELPEPLPLPGSYVPGDFYRAPPELRAKCKAYKPRAKPVKRKREKPPAPCLHPNASADTAGRGISASRGTTRAPQTAMGMPPASPVGASPRAPALSLVTGGGAGGAVARAKALAEAMAAADDDADGPLIHSGDGSSRGAGDSGGAERKATAEADGESTVAAEGESAASSDSQSDLAADACAEARAAEIAEAQEEWASDWLERVECWWIGLPGATQSWLGRCIGAFALSVGSKLDLVLRAARRRPTPVNVPPPQLSSGTRLYADELQCEGSAKELEEIELPAFPEIEMDDSDILNEFRLPPLPQLLPPSMQRMLTPELLSFLLEPHEDKKAPLAAVDEAERDASTTRALRLYGGAAAAGAGVAALAGAAISCKRRQRIALCRGGGVVRAGHLSWRRKGELTTELPGGAKARRAAFRSSDEQEFSCQ